MLNIRREHTHEGRLLQPGSAANHRTKMRSSGGPRIMASRSNEQGRPHSLGP